MISKLMGVNQSLNEKPSGKFGWLFSCKRDSPLPPYYNKGILKLK